MMRERTARRAAMLATTLALGCGATSAENGGDHGGGNAQGGARAVGGSSNGGASLLGGGVPARGGVSAMSGAGAAALAGKYRRSSTISASFSKGGSVWTPSRSPLA